MYRYFVMLGLVFGAGFLVTGVFASTTTETAMPQAEATVALAPLERAPAVTARAVAVVDMETGALLWETNSTTVLPIASITKLFTAAAISDTYPLTESITLTMTDLSAYGSAGRLTAGDTYTYRDLLFPLLLSSSNDAAYALRRQAPEVELLSRMEIVARQGGATQAQFADASGLADGNQATARGLAAWLRASFVTHPSVYDITRLSRHLGPYVGWQNNSPFIAMDGYRGGKHGYTTAAGRTAAVVFAEPVGDTVREVGYVVLGSQDVAADVTLLRTHVQGSVLAQ